MTYTRFAMTALLACFAMVVSPSRALSEIGVYFDTEANGSSCHAAAFVPFNTYIVLTDSPAESVEGVRVAYAISAHVSGPVPIVRISENVFGATGPISGNAVSGEYDLDWATPRQAGQTLVLVAWQLMLTNFDVLEISLAEVANPGVRDNLPEISSAGTSFPVPIAFACIGSGYGARSAIVNENCPLPVERRSWDSVRAMFR